MIKCAFIDYRSDFCSTLAEKLGSEFTLAPVLTNGEWKDCDVVMVGVPPPADRLFHPQLAALAAAAVNPAGTPAIVLLPAADHQLVLRSLADGAYDCFIETNSLEELRIMLRRAAHFHELSREVERLRDVASLTTGFEQILTADPKMKATCSLLAKVASTSATVLLTGESGTGKGLIATAIHKASVRSPRPFVALSCASLPEQLIEAELFGHEKGAFTGAVGARRGRFEAAGSGTIFLDEIGDLPPSMQVKLLRVLQERTFERLGSNEPRPMEARVICATHRPLRSLVKSGAFRADLFYRVSTVEVEIPALRERRGDILLLAHVLLRNFAAKHGRPANRFSPSVMAALQEHTWPGNVRELQNVIERAVVLSEGPEIGLADLPPDLIGIEAVRAMTSFEEEVREFKRRLILRTLTQTGYNKMQAARKLGIARSSLFRLIEELQIPSDNSPDREAAELELSEMTFPVKPGEA
ncbi:MAG TPA: sigma-54 dependent transcriptional regulator [Candidatus Angelobacter sp.]|nr:sigma-54 dependent transcriptional regulator [Candidatus Angelobacter sp.]